MSETTNPADDRAAATEAHLQADHRADWGAVFGQDKWHDAANWAKENLDREQMARFNERIGSSATRRDALVALKGAFETAKAAAHNPDARPFATAHEMRAAMAEARQRTRGHWRDDPDFMARLVRTPKSITAAV